MNPDRKHIKLTRDEVEYMKDWLTKKRMDFNTADDYDYHEQLNIPKDVWLANSFGGELAFCKLFGCYPGFDFRKRIRFDTWYRGRKIEIKTNHIHWGEDSWLKVKNVDYIHEKKTAPDFFCLMIGVLPEYWLGGFVTPEKLLVPENLMQLPGVGADGEERPPFYQMHLKELDPRITTE